MKKFAELNGELVLALEKQAEEKEEIIKKEEEEEEKKKEKKENYTKV